MTTMTKSDVTKIIRNHHWLELADFLGKQVGRVREDFTLYFRLLDSLGYKLVRVGANAETPELSVPTSPPEPVLGDPVDRLRLFGVVEEALAETTTRRVQGERVSDQAEVRAIVKAVLELLQ